MLLVRVSIFPYPPALISCASSTCLPHPTAGFAIFGLPFKNNVEGLFARFKFILPVSLKNFLDAIKVETYLCQ
jgi:hypothetical protein